MTEIVIHLIWASVSLVALATAFKMIRGFDRKHVEAMLEHERAERTRDDERFGRLLSEIASNGDTNTKELVGLMNKLEGRIRDMENTLE